MCQGKARFTATGTVISQEGLSAGCIGEVSLFCEVCGEGFYLPECAVVFEPRMPQAKSPKSGKKSTEGLV